MTVSYPELPAFDEDLGLHPLFFALAPDDANYAKVVFESHESLGVVRSHDTGYAAGRVLMVLLLVPDFAADGLRVAADLAREIDITFPSPTAAMLHELKRELLDELDR